MFEPSVVRIRRTHQRNASRAEMKPAKTLSRRWSSVITQQSTIASHARREVAHQNIQLYDSQGTVPVLPGLAFGHAQRARRHVGTEEGQVQRVGQAELPRDTLAVRSEPAARNRAFYE